LGCWRIRIFLDREGHELGRCYRLWRRTKLQVPRRRPSKAHRHGPAAAPGADRCQPGVVIRLRLVCQCLAAEMPDHEWTKEGLALEVDGRIRSGRVIEALSRLIGEHGCAAVPALASWRFRWLQAAPAAA
jgi:hypothetical protein